MLFGTMEDLRKEIKERCEVLGKGGGYILAPANHMQKDISPEKVIALFKFARQYGKYPNLGQD